MLVLFPPPPHVLVCTRFDAEQTLLLEWGLLLVYTLSTFCTLVFFILYAIKELTDSLGIYCFTITKKKGT